MDAAETARKKAEEIKSDTEAADSEAVEKVERAAEETEKPMQVWIRALSDAA